MDKRSTRLQEHRWRILAVGFACLSLYVILGELVPRAVSAYEIYGVWQQQETRIASVANWEVDQRQLAARKRLLQKRFAALYISLPRSDHMSIIVQVLQESADAHGVEVKTIRPTARASFATYETLPFQVVLEGSFHQLGAFIGRIEQSPYVIKVRHLQFKRASPTSGGLVADLLLSVIILKGQEGSP